MNKVLISILSLLSIFVLLFGATGCQTQPAQAPNVTLEGALITTGNTTTYVNQTLVTPNDTQQPEQIKGAGSAEDIKNVTHTITGTEGDLIKLAVTAVSPDGVPITYFYTAPFNNNGLWQTQDGDAGKYLVTVTATDGKLNTSADLLVIVKPSIKAPVIDCPENVYVKEGETVDLHCSFFDKQNYPIVSEYTGWMNSPTYTTNYDSSGDHKVLVRATNGYVNSTKTILVHVENVPRAPVFNVHLKDITVSETDIVTLKTNVTEPDIGVPIKLTYSDPFDTDGVWKTKIGDAGSYPVTVVATAGKLSTKETFTLTVKMINTAPVMATIQNITVNEGETVKIVPEVKDRENSQLTIKYTGWMTNSTYTTTFDDAYAKGCDTRGCSATYKVTVTASDGEFNTSQDVYVTVVDKNRPPVFVWP